MYEGVISTVEAQINDTGWSNEIVTTINTHFIR